MNRVIIEQQQHSCFNKQLSLQKLRMSLAINSAIDYVAWQNLGGAADADDDDDSNDISVAHTYSMILLQYQFDIHFAPGQLTSGQLCLMIPQSCPLLPF